MCDNLSNVAEASCEVLLAEVVAQPPVQSNGTRIIRKGKAAFCRSEIPVGSVVSICSWKRAVASDEFVCSHNTMIRLGANKAEAATEAALNLFISLNYAILTFIRYNFHKFTGICMRASHFVRLG